MYFFYNTFCVHIEYEIKSTKIPSTLGSSKQRLQVWAQMPTPHAALSPQTLQDSEHHQSAGFNLDEPMWAMWLLMPSAPFHGIES